MWRLLAVAAVLSGCLAAGQTVAAPAGFACSKPIIAATEDEAHSRYGIAGDEHVFDVQVYVNAPQRGDSISVTAKQHGYCRLILPVGAALTRAVWWREASGARSDRAAFHAIDIREADGAGANRDWLILSARNPTVSGVVTLEFHVLFDYPEPND